MQTFAILAALVAAASAQRQAAAYGQCGGRNHQAKACASGFKCHVYNDWYSQCVPAVASSAVKPSSSKCSTVISKLCCMLEADTG